MTRSWLVRLGKFGEAEARALEHGQLITGWKLEDIVSATSRDEILHALERTYPSEKAGTLQNWAVQINQLKHGAQPGDLTVTPLKTTGQIAIGQIEGGFVQVDGAPARNVRWLKKDVDRSAVKQDLLFSLGASQTVAEVSRNEAPRRFEALARDGRDPGPSVGVAPSRPAEAPAVISTDSEAELIELSSLARDQIERHITANFVGHGFTELIAAILRAQGYQARVSPPGSDRGVDIVAGQGALGFGGPRLVIQVKSGSVVADQPALQSLIGCIQDTHAEHGLIVSWGGFTGAVRQRINELYFRVRLWDKQEILNALFATYDQLPEAIRAELPLKRIWTLVPPSGGEL
jgi:restriction system protein